MLIVQCGCSAVVINVDNGRSDKTVVGGALCKDCSTNDGDYVKSPYWKEVDHTETESSAAHSGFESSGGMVVQFPDKQADSKNAAKKREKRRVGTTAKRAQ